MKATGPMMLACVLAASGCEAGAPGDGGIGVEASLDADAAGGEPAVDVEEGVEGEPRAADPGPLTLVATTGEILTERLCDLDGDGTGDNAVADLGSPGAALFAASLSATLDDSLSSVPSYLFHLPWVDDRSVPETAETRFFAFLGRDTDVPPEPEDDLLGGESFWVDSRSLDGCGEPENASALAVLEGGTLSGTGSVLPISMGGALAPVRELTFSGTFAPRGESWTFQACGLLSISDLGALDASDTLEGLSLLEALLAGGATVGLYTVPGLSPDLDLDGDGLERVQLDSSHHVERCIDGDLTVIEGDDCWQDERIADAFALAVVLEGVSARYAGREPGWEHQVSPVCEGGLPSREESAWFSPVYGEAARCAGLDEPCDSLATGNQCCDPLHRCSGLVSDGYRCRAPCEPSRCSYGDRLGMCTTVAGSPVCLPAGTSPEPADCAPGEQGCSTEYGATEATTCVPYRAAADRSFDACLEGCSTTPTGCERDVGCRPLRFEAGGVCARYP